MISSVESMKDLFVEQGRELYSSTKQELKELPIIEKSVTSKKLKSLIEKEMKIAKEQKNRLKSTFERMKVEPDGEKCCETETILSQAKKQAVRIVNPNLRDASIISAIQNLNHRKIAGFGTTAAFAREIGLEDAARTMRVGLAEEKEIDHELSLLAESEVNKMAHANLIR